MSNYPPPQYGGGYSSHDQSSMPYVPPAYPPQYFPTNSQQGGHGQVNTASAYGTYGYNQIMPVFGAIPNPGISPVPLFQGWNHEHVPAPPFSSTSQHSLHTGYSPEQQQNQPYPLHNRTGWQQPSFHGAVSYDQQDMVGGDFQEDNIVKDASAPNYSASRRRSSAGNMRYRQSPIDGQVTKRRSPTRRASPAGMFPTKSPILS